MPYYLCTWNRCVLYIYIYFFNDSFLLSHSTIVILYYTLCHCVKLIIILLTKHSREPESRISLERFTHECGRRYYNNTVLYAPRDVHFSHSMATAALRGDHDGSGGADTTTTAAATATAGMAFGRRTRVVCHGVRFPCRRRRSAPTRTHRRNGRAAATARLGPRAVLARNRVTPMYRSCPVHTPRRATV